MKLTPAAAAAAATAANQAAILAVMYQRVDRAGRMQKAPAMARQSGRRPGVLQAARGEDPRAHIVHLESGDPQRRRGRQCGVAVHPHRFRHHFSHTWLDRGGPEGDLMELNGWASPQDAPPARRQRPAAPGPTAPTTAS